MNLWSESKFQYSIISLLFALMQKVTKKSRPAPLPFLRNFYRSQPCDPSGDLLRSFPQGAPQAASF